jgi:hypothetical protein
MLRRNIILMTAAVLTVFVVPASASTWENLRVPDAKEDAAREADATTGPSQDLRPPDVKDGAEGRGPYAVERGPYVLKRSYGSPDAADAARNRSPVQIPAPVVAVRDAPGGFSWGDAGIGAAGMLALFSIAAGSALFVAGRRRRRSVGVATH